MRTMGDYYADMNAEQQEEVEEALSVPNMHFALMVEDAIHLAMKYLRSEELWQIGMFWQSRDRPLL